MGSETFAGARLLLILSPDFVCLCTGVRGLAVVDVAATAEFLASRGGFEQCLFRNRVGEDENPHSSQPSLVSC